MHASLVECKGCLQKRDWGESGKSCFGYHCCLHPVPSLLSYPKEPQFIEMWASAKWLRGTEFSTLFWILLLLWGFHWFGLIDEMYRFPSLIYRHDSQGLSGTFRSLYLLQTFHIIMKFAVNTGSGSLVHGKSLVAFIHSARSGDFNWSQLTNRKVTYF